MKRAFILFKQQIIKNKKRLIYGVLALFISQIGFLSIGGIQNEVFADNRSSSESATQKGSFDNMIQEKESLLDFYKKTAYILVYPMMFLAGKLVDNSLVYGEVFHFDVVLWDLWNMIRNFANFGLGFLFIYYIFRYLIKQDKSKDPKWIIKNSLIAGVGIQASWFLMAVLIDISTIMIYGIGGLPLSILGGSDNATTIKDTDSYAMKYILSVDANDISNTNFYLTNILTGSGGDQIYISECATFSTKDTKDNFMDIDEYILGPKMIYYQDQSGKIYHTSRTLCDYYGRVYVFTEPYGPLLNITQPVNLECSSPETCKKEQSNYDVNKNTVKGYFKDKPEEIPAGQILSTFDTIKEKGSYGFDEGNKYIVEQKNVKTQKTSELMKSKDTKTYVGVFTTLYASLLEAGRGMLPSTDKSLYLKFLSSLVTTGHAVAIAIPLAAAVLVLIMRVAIIWMAIVLSPIIVLLSVFGFLDGKGNEGGILGYLNLKSLIGIIFSPVVICFAVSMSTVLVRIIDKINFDRVLFNDEFEVMGLIKMTLVNYSVGLSSLIVGVAGVAISWFLVWTAVQSSKLGKSGIITSVKKLASTSLGSVGFIPIPKKDGNGVELVGANSVFGLNDSTSIIEKYTNNIKSKFVTKDNEALKQFLDPENAKKEAEEKRETQNFQTYSNALFNPNQEVEDWTNIGAGDGNITFNSLSENRKKEIIEKINALENDDRKDAFGKVGTVEVGSQIYTYDKDKHMFKIKNK